MRHVLIDGEMNKVNAITNLCNASTDFVFLFKINLKIEDEISFLRQKEVDQSEKIRSLEEVKMESYVFVH